MSQRLVPLLDSDHDDIEAALEELDTMTAEQMEYLETCLDERLREERLQKFGVADDIDDDEESLFSDIELNYRGFSSLHRPEHNRNREYNDSPIRQRYCKNDIRITAPALDKQEEIFRQRDPESHDLLNKASSQLMSLYTLLDEIDALDQEINPLVKGNLHHQTEIQQKENDLPNEPTFFIPIHEESPIVERRKPLQTLDKRLRPVLAPAPGRANYKYDPVTMHQMYKEEWKRVPPPNEQKRLSLRWKVRDFLMSKKFMPKKFPTGEPTQHPKDWSPKPYLD